MANPVAYFNTRSSSITVGGWSVPANRMVMIQGNDMYVAPNLSSRMTISTYDLNSAVNRGDLKKAYTNAHHDGFLNNLYVGSFKVSNKSLTNDYIWGYKFYVRRNTYAYRGTTRDFLIPAGAYVIASGNSTVGDSYKHRLAITGVEMSASVAAKATGYPLYMGNNTVWHTTCRLDPAYGWWVDLQCNQSSYATRGSVAVRF